jgi:hypothetical protein
MRHTRSSLRFQARVASVPTQVSSSRRTIANDDLEPGVHARAGLRRDFQDRQSGTYLGDVSERGLAAEPRCVRQVDLGEEGEISLDNEAGLASGWFDVGPSPTGEEQARMLGVRRRDDHYRVVYCSALSRSFRTAEIAFGDRSLPIVRDARLRECDYGDLTRRPTPEIEQRRARHVEDPFPNGESYLQVVGTESPNGSVMPCITSMPARSS